MLYTYVPAGCYLCLRSRHRRRRFNSLSLASIRCFGVGASRLLFASFASSRANAIAAASLASSALLRAYTPAAPETNSRLS